MIRLVELSNYLEILSGVFRSILRDTNLRNGNPKEEFLYTANGEKMWLKIIFVNPSDSKVVKIQRIANRYNATMAIRFEQYDEMCGECDACYSG